MVENIHEILPKNFKIEKLNKEPFVFLEGPVWDKNRNRLYFSDPLARTIIFMQKTGEFQVLKENTGYVNGMCLSRDGNLAVCNMEAGSLDEVCPETGKTLKIIAKGYDGRPFNATNDVICDKKGGYYVTDPFFTFGPKTQEIEATYYVDPDGAVELAASDSKKPNGLAFSNDGAKLYIDDTGSASCWCYTVLPDGRLTDGKVVCTLALPENPDVLPEVQRYGEADGLKVDCLGNIYVTTLTGIQVFRPDGSAIGIIPMPGKESAANCEFGDADLKTLYITARSSLYRVRLNVAGV